MKRNLALLLSLPLLGAAALSGGCSSSRNTVTVHESTQITKGRELTDLRRALEARAVTPDEYEGLRRVILDRPN